LDSLFFLSFSFLFFFFHFSFAGERQQPPSLFQMIEPNLSKNRTAPFCPTTEVYYFQKALHNITAYEGESGLLCGAEAVGCDDPNVRDLFTEGERLVLRVAVRVFCFSNGTCPNAPNGLPLTQQTIDDQMEQLRIDWKDNNIGFELDAEAVEFYKEDQCAYLPEYGSSDEWYYRLMECKALGAFSPETHLNIFITGQVQGNQGTLLGIGTFPWTPEATNEYGGLWINAAFTGLGQLTASHELGRN
jgi:hypothetical protein